MNTELLLTIAGLLVMILIGFLALRGLRQPDHTRIAAAQLADARIKFLQHTAAAEEHSTAASMYQVRMERLDGMLVLKGEPK